MQGAEDGGYVLLRVVHQQQHALSAHQAASDQCIADLLRDVAQRTIGHTPVFTIERNFVAAAGCQVVEENARCVVPARVSRTLFL
jgi:hypothetical protein